MKHFTYFPIIEYSSKQATNILVRSKIRELVKQNTTGFYNHIVTDTDRPDTLSHAFYGTSNYTWLIFYANDIYDPFYDWPLSDRDFEKFIVSKYGSIGNARSEADESIVLTMGVGSGAFQVGQQAFQGTTFNDSISRGIVTAWDPVKRRLRLRNVQGNFHPGSGNVVVTGGGVNYSIKFRTSLIDHYEVVDGDRPGLIIDQSTFLNPNAFPGLEKKAVTHYENELRLNEAKRNIKIFKKDQIGKIINELRVIFL
jgi:hypothetical protein